MVTSQTSPERWVLKFIPSLLLCTIGENVDVYAFAIHGFNMRLGVTVLNPGLNQPFSLATTAIGPSMPRKYSACPRALGWDGRDRSADSSRAEFLCPSPPSAFAALARQSSQSKLP